MKKSVASLILIIAFLACSNGNRIVVEDDQAVHPILNMELVEIPSNGNVFKIDGSAEIKKTGSAGYSDVAVGDVVGDGDILWLKINSIVGIRFADGSYLLNEPQGKDNFITFKSPDFHTQ